MHPRFKFTTLADVYELDLDYLHKLITNTNPLPNSTQVHPRFKFTPQADRYDVAVIRLQVPVHYEPHIQPICLPDKGTDFMGHFGWAAGWGALKAGRRRGGFALKAGRDRWESLKEGGARVALKTGAGTLKVGGEEGREVNGKWLEELEHETNRIL